MTIHGTSYRYELVVPEEALDDNEHVNNVVYLEWIQDAAIRHAEASGAARMTRAAEAVWVVVEHRIRYVRPALLGDLVEVRTWVENIRRALSMRRTEIVRLGGAGRDAGEKLAEGWTDWAFVDVVSGRPKRIPLDVAELFVPRSSCREEGRAE